MGFLARGHPLPASPSGWQPRSSEIGDTAAWGRDRPLEPAGTTEPSDVTSRHWLGEPALPSCGVRIGPLSWRGPGWRRSRRKEGVGLRKEKGRELPAEAAGTSPPSGVGMSAGSPGKARGVLPRRGAAPVPAWARERPQGAAGTRHQGAKTRAGSQHPQRGNSGPPSCHSGTGDGEAGFDSWLG